jgi:Flp pilus assembly pilin Flp
MFLRHGAEERLPRGVQIDTRKRRTPIFGRYIMKALKLQLKKLVKDEQGGEILEYALVAGLIVVAAIAVLGAVGGKVVAKWTSLNSSL